jgi:hypothetical protein
MDGDTRFVACTRDVSSKRCHQSSLHCGMKTDRKIRPSRTRVLVSAAPDIATMELIRSRVVDERVAGILSGHLRHQ